MTADSTFHHTTYCLQAWVGGSGQHMAVTPHFG